MTIEHFLNRCRRNEKRINSIWFYLVAPTNVLNLLLVFHISITMQLKIKQLKLKHNPHGHMQTLWQVHTNHPIVINTLVLPILFRSLFFHIRYYSLLFLLLIFSINRFSWLSITSVISFGRVCTFEKAEHFTIIALLMRITHCLLLLIYMRMPQKSAFK